MQKGNIILANALIWGFVLISCSIVLKDSGTFPDIQLILGGGAVISLLVIATAGMRESSQRN